MKNSVLQFKNPQLTKLIFEINPNYVVNNQQINIKKEFKTNIIHLQENEDIVEFTIIIGTNDNTSPFYIEATESAIFKFNGSDETAKNNLLKCNAPAVLLGYLRPIISTITALSPYSAYNLPLIDFTE